MKESAFNVIYKEYSARIYSFALWMTRNRAAADDIAQSVFVKVWHHDGGPADHDERRRWLFTVARNACMDHFRSSKRVELLHSRFSQEYEGPADEPGNTHVWEQLGDLSETDRAILYLHIKLGYSYAEIGAIISLAEGNVRIKAFRALRQLRQNLSGTEDL